MPPPMQARAFRFDSFRFSPRKPRSPLLRVLFSLVGLALLALLVFFGLFVGAAMLVIGLAWRLLARRSPQIDCCSVFFEQKTPHVRVE